MNISMLKKLEKILSYYHQHCGIAAIYYSFTCFNWLTQSHVSLSRKARRRRFKNALSPFTAIVTLLPAHFAHRLSFRKLSST